jgi:type VI secretion system secreted protein VgrG
MSGDLDQSERVAELKTPLGSNVLVLEKFDVSEGLSDLFEVHIDALSKKETVVNFDDILGQACTIEVRTHEKKKRYFNGILTGGRWVGDDGTYNEYELVLRPWLWLLGQKADCRIYLDKTVKDIIKDVFDRAGLGEHRFATTGSYDKIEYCVQYRETDLAFVSRLMEEYGIYYFFEHADGNHTLVMADSPSSHKPIPELPKMPFYTREEGALHREQQINEWISERRFRTGKVEYNDYDYLEPKKNLRAPKEASEKYKHSKLEVYDYPGKYDDKGKGEKFAQFRLEAEQATDHRRIGDGDAPSLFAGGTVKLEKHSDSENKDYLVVRTSHSCSSQSYRSGASHLSGEYYRGRYEFQPKDRPFRSLPHTPKPRIYGIQTAKVVGKKNEDGEEISTDEHGRIWVQFFWDREPQKSCPIRIAQVWSGKQWGGIFIPRVGMEVVVEFLEGDPDRPLVTGCVYNGDLKVPYDLPDNKTKAGLKSDSTKGGNGYNELVFEDKKYSEEIGLHAQKDYKVVVLDTETREIGERFTGQKAGINSRKTTLLQGSDDLTIASGGQKITIALTKDVTIGMSHTETVGASQTSTIGASQSITVGAAQTTTVGGTVTITSVAGITLISGGSTVLINPAGVQIIAPTFTVVAQGGIAMKGAVGGLAL